MIAVLGIALLIGGAVLTFAVDHSVDGVDVAAVGWILMAGGGLSLLAGTIRAALFTTTPSTDLHPHGDVAPPPGLNDVEDAHAE